MPNFGFNSRFKFSTVVGEAMIEWPGKRPNEKKMYICSDLNRICCGFGSSCMSMGKKATRVFYALLFSLSFAIAWIMKSKAKDMMRRIEDATLHYVSNLSLFDHSHRSLYL